MQRLAKQFMKNDGYVVCWQYHQILWGKWQQQFIWPADNDIIPSCTIELRIFNKQEEIHLKRQGNQFKGRYVQDDAGTVPCEYVDSASPLWGRKKKLTDDGFMVLADADRKLSMQIPAINDGTTYLLQTRNYIGVYAETSQVGYRDNRFVAIMAERKK